MPPRCRGNRELVRVTLTVHVGDGAVVARLSLFFVVKVSAAGSERFLMVVVGHTINRGGLHWSLRSSVMGGPV